MLIVGTAPSVIVPVLVTNDVFCATSTQSNCPTTFNYAIIDRNNTHLKLVAPRYGHGHRTTQARPRHATIG